MERKAAEEASASADAAPGGTTVADASVCAEALASALARIGSAEAELASARADVEAAIAAIGRK